MNFPRLIGLATGVLVLAGRGVYTQPPQRARKSTTLASPAAEKKLPDYSLGMRLAPLKEYAAPADQFEF